VFLVVVVFDPLLMGSHEFGPAFRFCKVVVCHSHLDGEGSLSVVLPGFALLDLLLLNAQGFVDSLRPVGLKVGARVGNECLR